VASYKDSPDPALPPSDIAVARGWRHPFVIYLMIGGLSFVVDAGLLVLLSGPLGRPVWLAATVGYWTSVLVNFGLNRRTMAIAPGRLRGQSVRYGVLLAGNYAFTLLVLYVGVAFGVPVIVAKCVALGLCTVVNYLLYRRWVFA
jgi:putative flippase GtrA